MNAPRLPALVGTGLAAGFLSGLFGLGGGTLIVPALVLLLGMAQRAAHATSLVAVVPIAVVAVVGYAVEGQVDVLAALLLTTGSVLGAVVGTRLLDTLPERELRWAFAVALLLTAVRLLFYVEADSEHAIDLAAAVALVVVGFVAGVLAGLLGVGGGIVMVPAMILLLGIPTVVAKGTSLLVIIPTAVVGTWRNVRNGNADVRVGAIVGLTGVLTGYAGAYVSLLLDPRVSAVLFALLLAVVAVRMLRAR